MFHDLGVGSAHFTKDVGIFESGDFGQGTTDEVFANIVNCSCDFTYLRHSNLAACCVYGEATVIDEHAKSARGFELRAAVA